MKPVLQQSTTSDMVVGSNPTNPYIETPRFTRRETLLTMAGVLLVMLLASLDQTIVGTAMPHIISDLQGFDRYTWVTTAYLLTSTVMVPIYGKLSDIFGRKPIFLIGVVLFLIGSAASGASQTMNQRSEEHTSELQSRPHLVCRLLLEKKKAQSIHAAQLS